MQPDDRSEPIAVAPTTDGGFLIADTGNHVIRKVCAQGVITRVAGIIGAAGASGDGRLATEAPLSSPTATRWRGGDVVAYVISNWRATMALGYQSHRHRLISPAGAGACRGRPESGGPPSGSLRPKDPVRSPGAGATLPRMGTSGSYVSWGVLQISVTNLVVILLMLAIFALAVLVPFGHRDQGGGR